MNNIIAIVNQKGGCAKTLSTFTLGNILADMGKKVLMIDLDPQSSLTICCGINVELANMYHVMCKKEKFKNVVINTCGKENLFIAPSTIDLAIAELQLVNEMARENILKRALDEIKEEFDFILIDCPPSLGLLVVNALTATNKVLITVSADYLAYRGLNLLIDTINNIKYELNEKLEIIGVLVTLYNSRTLHANEIVDILEEKFHVIGKIGSSTKVRDAILDSKTIVDIDKNHKIAIEYSKVAEVIANV